MRFSFLVRNILPEMCATGLSIEIDLSSSIVQDAVRWRFKDCDRLCESGDQVIARIGMGFPELPNLLYGHCPVFSQNYQNSESFTLRRPRLPTTSKSAPAVAPRPQAIVQPRADA